MTSSFRELLGGVFNYVENKYDEYVESFIELKGSIEACKEEIGQCREALRGILTEAKFEAKFNEHMTTHEELRQQYEIELSSLREKLEQDIKNEKWYRGEALKERDDANKERDDANAKLSLAQETLTQTKAELTQANSTVSNLRGVQVQAAKDLFQAQREKDDAKEELVLEQKARAQAESELLSLHTFLNQADIERYQMLDALVSSRASLQVALEVEHRWAEYSPRKRWRVLTLAARDSLIKRVHDEIVRLCKEEGRPATASETELLRQLIEERNLGEEVAREMREYHPDEFYDRKKMISSVNVTSGRVQHVWLFGIQIKDQIEHKALVEVTST